MPSLINAETENSYQHLASQTLVDFIELAWPIVEPSTPFVKGKHIEAIAKHLEAVTDGNIQNLLINIPPRHMKSLAVCVFWPAWEWITHPGRRWLFASYALSLSVRDSVRCRRLIESPWYQARWADRFALTSDQNQKMRFDNDKAGSRISTSVGGAATGEGGDRVIVDDPHNVSERESESIRRATLEWWDLTMSTRLNNPKTGAKVIVMQRVHEKDLSGHVLEQGGYVHLCLPAEFESARRCVTSLDWRDPRTGEGDLLWPARIGPAEISDFKLRLGPAGYAGQFQQRPTPAGGNRFRAEWFRYYQVIGRPRDRAPCGPISFTESAPSGPLSLRERVGVRGGREETFREPTARETPPHPNPLPEGEGANAREEVNSGEGATPAAGEHLRAQARKYVLLHSSGTETIIPSAACTRFAVMDPAGSEPDQNNRPCYTVIQVWDVTPDHDMILVHQYRQQVQAPDAAAAAVKISRDFKVDYIGIEKDGLGLGIVQTVRRSGVTVKPIKARGSKEARSETAEIRMAAGMIYFPHGAEFLFDLEQELLHFPHGEYCDQVDALAHAAMLVQQRNGPPGVKVEADVEEIRAAEDEDAWD